MRFNKLTLAVFLIISAMFFQTGCESKFDIYDESPNWLGPNIYDYLSAQKNFSITLKLIDDCGYKEVMQKTGSVTLFVANDEAFTRFFANNEYGVKSYEDMPKSLKFIILRSGLLTNAYLTEKLSTTENGNLGQILRRTTAFQATDVVPLVNGDQMPDTKYWQKYKGKIFPLLQDGSDWTMLHFTEKSISMKGITAEDFKFISGKEWTKGDVYVFGKRLIQKDIACKNGYLNVLEDVYIPPVNMAQLIKMKSETSKFNSLMDRFSAPYFYGLFYNETTQTNDSLFQLRYFNSGSNPLTKEPDAKGNPSGNTVEALLLFDPGWNKIQTNPGANLYGYDMPAIFVPSNSALNDYFSPGGNGNDLYDEFKVWENVPNNIVADFISNHMKKSFLSSLPSQFGVMKDESGYLMNISKSDIISTDFTRNGLVYTINKVLPPLDYRTVIGPVKINSSTSLFMKAQSDAYTKFIYYFRSLLNNYTYFVTVDSHFKGYRDPVSQGYVPAKREEWKFRNNNGSLQVVAYRSATDSSVYTDNRVNNRLNDILDLQTLVGDIIDDQIYYIYKGGGAVKITGNVTIAPGGKKVFSVNTKIEGGGNIEKGNEAHILKSYVKENGVTYFIDGIVENPVTSVFGRMKENPKFSRFFELCNQADLFVSATSTTTMALNYKIKFFDLFHYTIYIPTNEALDAVIGTSVLPSQAQIDNASSETEKTRLEEKRQRFLRYHFQDNSIFIGGEKNNAKAFLSATLNKNSGKFYPLFVTNNNSQLTIRDYMGNNASVITENDNYNLMARDIVLNTNNPNTATTITTSSFAVIHLIDKVLRCE